jgi:parallel beta-helix repeat protein
VHAGEGRTPVYLPGTVITAPGTYVLTRDIAGNGSSPAITIGTGGSVNGVDLDLNGFTVSCPFGGTAIQVLSDASPVKIRNGTIFGGDLGIDAPAFNPQLVIEDMKIYGIAVAGIHLANTAQLAVRRVHLSFVPQGQCITWSGAGHKHGTIEDSVFQDCNTGIVITADCGSVAVVNNRFDRTNGSAGTYAGDAIVLNSCSSALVSGNTLSVGSSEGISVIDSRGVKLVDNTVMDFGADGIHLDATTTDCLVANNISSGNGAFIFTPGSGLLVQGQRNKIEGNVLNGNKTAGLLFFEPETGQPCGNVFGKNVARGNQGLGLPACNGTPALFPPDSCNTAVTCAQTNDSYGENLIPGPALF